MTGFPVYTALYYAAAALTAPFYAIRGLRRGKYLSDVSARLGRQAALPETPGPRVWVHALSLGEVNTAVSLVRRLAAEGFDVCISAVTSSGRKACREQLPDTPLISAPFDFPVSVKNVVAAVRPDLFILVETDIWPNLQDGLRRAGVPRMLVNTRLSPRSMQGYRRMKPFWRRVLSLFDYIGCQSRDEKVRLLQAGAPPGRTHVAGNLKFDRPIIETDPHAREKLMQEHGLPNGLWLAAGSTHAGEDETLLDIYPRLRRRRPDLKLLLAPRQRERFEPVRRLIENTGLSAAAWSGGRVDRDIAVYLLDTHGRLDDFYELADLVFVGKSMPGSGEGGGHNLLEPAARRKPVVFGPRMHNFPQIASMMQECGAGLQVTDPGDLETALARLLADPETRRRMGDSGRRLIEENRGALDRTMEAVHELVRRGKEEQ